MPGGLWEDGDRGTRWLLSGESYKLHELPIPGSKSGLLDVLLDMNNKAEVEDEVWIKQNRKTIVQQSN